MATGAGVGGGIRGYSDNAAYNAAQDTGSVMLAVRNDTINALAISDGNYSPLQTDSSGSLYVTLGGSLVHSEDDAHNSGDAGLMMLGVRQDSQADFGADGDYVPLSITGDGEVRVTTDALAQAYLATIGSNTTTVATAVHSEDDAHDSGDAGIQMLAVRNDTLAALAGSDGDYSPLQVSSTGALHTQALVGDPEMNSAAHVSHFGALKTSGCWPVERGNFAGSSLDSTVWTDHSNTDAFTLVYDGVGELHSGTDQYGHNHITSVRNGVFESGQITVYQSGVYAGVGVTNATKKWGLMRWPGCSALYFEWASISWVILREPAQAGASGTITLGAAASSTDDIYNNYEVRIVGGTGQGQTRTVSDYDGTTKVATVSSNWDIAPDTTSRYVVGGVVQAATSTTATLAGAESSTDDVYNDNWMIGIYEGTGQGQERIITDWNGTTKVATVGAWTTTPDTTSKYYLYSMVDTATSSTATLFAPHSSTDDAYNGYDLWIMRGARSGQIRTISDYVGSTLTATLSSDWANTPDADTAVFQVVARRRFFETAVVSADFNGEVWTPSAANNTFRIHYSAGRALFQRAAAGKIRTLHTMVDSDYPLVCNLDMGMFYQVANYGNTTDHFMRLRGASTSIFGQLPTTRPSGALTDSSVLPAHKAITTGQKPDETYGNMPVQGTVASTTDVLGGTTLTAEFSAGGTTMTVDDTSDFASSGRLWIQSTDGTVTEEVSYTGKTSTTFTGCTRARAATSDQTHASGSYVGEMWTSAILDVDNYTQIQSELFSSGTARFMGTWYVDNTDQDTSQIIRSFFILYTSGVLENNTAPRLSRYVRLAWAPTDGVTQTSTLMRFNLLTSAVSGNTVSVSGFVAGNMVANVSRSITVGKQPDGDYVNAPADGAAWETTATLSGDAEYTSAWTDTDGWNSIEIFINSDVVSAFKGIQVQFTDNTQAGSPTVRATRYFTFSAYDLSQTFKVVNVPPLLDGFRVVYTNGSSAQSSFYCSATLKTNQSNDQFNPGQALLIGEFETEVALGAIDNYEYVFIEGRNPDTDAGQTGDVWDDATNTVGDVVYAGQPVEDPSETVDVVSSSADDTAAGTGARTVRIYGLKSTESEEYETEDITLNGTTAVSSSNNWYRITRIKVLTAGSGGENAGILQVYHTTTTANLFIDLPVGQNESHNAVYTVPANRQLLIKRMQASVVRSNGSAGSAYVRMLVRDTLTEDAVYRPECNMDIQTGSRFVQDFRGGIKFGAGSDIKVEVTDVSDNNTSTQAIIEGTLIAT